MYRSEGLTLVEMMCSTALIAILAVLATPTFVDMRYDAERTTTVNNFFHSLFLARSESIKRGEVVSVCRSFDGQTCSTGQAPWQVGWIVFVNDDRDEPADRDPEESLLAVHQAWPAGTITSNRSTYSFRPQVQGVINGTIVFCDPRGAEHARAIIISHSGRPRVARKDASGKPLKCDMS